MKIKLIAISILMTTLLCSCQKKTDEPKPQPQTTRPPQKTMIAPNMQMPEIHSVEVTEVIQATAYTYLKVKENNTDFWIAIKKAEMEVGETISYANPLEMIDFTSKDLNRTFDKIYFISSITQGNASSPAKTAPPMKPTLDKKDISIEPVEGGITIGELYSGKDTYADKTVIVKGKVTKFRAAIMKRNWVHLQDGTTGDGKFDLTITTQDTVAVGDVVTFEGKITLNKDFGAGYKYELIMEDAKKK